MSFRIEWKSQALLEFTLEWDRLAKANQKTVMEALDGIDFFLTQSPMTCGESRSRASDRILIHPPVSIGCEVEMRLQLVTIFEARIFKRLR